MDRQEMEEQITENAQRISDNVNEIIKIKTSVFGINGNNGLNGRQRDMETDIETLKQAVTEISTNFKNMGTKINNMERSARFWTRTIGMAVIVQVIAILFSLMQSHPLIK